MTPRALGACLGWRRTERLKGRTVAGSPWQRYSRRYSTSSTAGKTRRARNCPEQPDRPYAPLPHSYPSRHGIPAAMVMHAVAAAHWSRGAEAVQWLRAAVGGCWQGQCRQGCDSWVGSRGQRCMALLPRHCCEPRAMLRNVTNRSPNAARPLCEHVLRSHPARGRIVVAAELVPKRRVTRANGCRVLSGAEPVRVRTGARRARSESGGRAGGRAA